MFDAPGVERKLPDTLRVVRDRSVEAFRAKLGIFASDDSIREYKNEITRLMNAAYEKGRIDGK